MSKAPKTKVISVRLPTEQREAVEMAAVKAGTIVSGYIADVLAHALLNKPYDSTSTKPAVAPSVPVAQTDPALLEELRRIGINLNQIARATNSGVAPDLLELARALGGVLVGLKAPDELMKQFERVVTDLGRPKPAPPPMASAPAPSVAPRAPVAPPKPPTPPPAKPAAPPLPSKAPIRGYPTYVPTETRPGTLQDEDHWSFDSDKRGSRTPLQYDAPYSFPYEPDRPVVKQPAATTKKDERRDYPHSPSRNKLQDRNRLHPARPAKGDKRPRGLASLFELWKR